VKDSVVIERMTFLRITCNICYPIQKLALRQQQRPSYCFFQKLFRSESGGFKPIFNSHQESDPLRNICNDLIKHNITRERATPLNDIIRLCV
jgi:hypothetical protein